jgi:hypothetical protein
MPGPEEIDRNVQRVVIQLNDAIGDMAGGTDLTGAIGELLKITLRHDTRITELESRVRELEQNQRQ